MYSLNTVKNTYLEVSKTTEIYRLETNIPLTHSDLVDQDSDKDFDHVKQLITIYGKILFFTKPNFKLNRYEFVFGVEQPDLFQLHNDPVGVLKARLQGIVLFGGKIVCNGVNTNTWIKKF
jgi:hypothetical protein